MKKDVLIGGSAILIFIVIMTIIGRPITDPVAEPVACTMDARQCPDGSYVGRIAPFCEFAECPALGSTTKKVAPVEKVTTVTYTAQGFSPAKMTVTVGTKVEFKNSSNYFFQLESALFSHDIDIAPGNKYIHVFDTPGTWEYHNANDPEQTGTVVVK